MRTLSAMVEKNSVPSQRNPDWSWDEQILAFDLFLREGWLDKGHPDVQELSALLNSLTIHPMSSRTPTFRNPNGVGRKLADIQTHEPGYAGKTTSGSRLDREVWATYGGHPHVVTDLATAIREGSRSVSTQEEDEEEIEATHREGRITFRLHRHRERNPSLRKKKLKQMQARLGRLSCEACENDLSLIYGEVGALVYECHHLQPLHVTGETVSSLEDVVILCPTCHRVAHRIFPWPTLDDLQAAVRSS